MCGEFCVDAKNAHFDHVVKEMKQFKTSKLITGRDLMRKPTPPMCAKNVNARHVLLSFDTVYDVFCYELQKLFVLCSVVRR